MTDINDLFGKYKSLLLYSGISAVGMALSYKLFGTGVLETLLFSKYSEISSNVSSEDIPQIQLNVYDSNVSVNLINGSSSESSSVNGSSVESILDVASRSTSNRSSSTVLNSMLDDASTAGNFLLVATLFTTLTTIVRKSVTNISKIRGIFSKKK